ncbi:MAG: energy transducer TonB [bacterium]
MFDFRRPRHLVLAVLPAALAAGALAATDEAPVPDGYFKYDKPPKLVRFAEPVYPAEALAGQIEGVVMLRLVVGVTGDVLSATASSSTAEIFEIPAMAAAEQWKFEPAEAEGQPVPATIVVPMEFSLNPGSGHGSPTDGGRRAAPRPAPPADARSELDHVCQTALDTKKMKDRWEDPTEGVPFVVLRNQQLRQFGARVAPALEMSDVAIPTVEREELGDLPYVEFTRIAIQGGRASVEYEYHPARLSCAVELEWKNGRWKVKKQKVTDID